MVKSVEDRVEQAIRNIQRRKYSKLCGGYANSGVDLFNGNQLAQDLGIQPSQLEDILPIKAEEAESLLRDMTLLACQYTGGACPYAKCEGLECFIYRKEKGGLSCAQSKTYPTQ